MICQHTSLWGSNSFLSQLIMAKAKKYHIFSKSTMKWRNSAHQQSEQQRMSAVWHQPKPSTSSSSTILSILAHHWSLDSGQASIVPVIMESGTFYFICTSVRQGVWIVARTSISVRSVEAVCYLKMENVRTVPQGITEQVALGVSRAMCSAKSVRDLWQTNVKAVTSHWFYQEPNAFRILIMKSMGSTLMKKQTK